MQTIYRTRMTFQNGRVKRALLALNNVWVLTRAQRLVEHSYCLVKISGTPEPQSKLPLQELGPPNNPGQSLNDQLRNFFIFTVTIIVWRLLDIQTTLRVSMCVVTVNSKRYVEVLNHFLVPKETRWSQVFAPNSFLLN